MLSLRPIPSCALQHPFSMRQLELLQGREDTHFSSDVSTSKAAALFSRTTVLSRDTCTYLQGRKVDIMTTPPLLLNCLLLGLVEALLLLLLLSRSRIRRRLHCPWCWDRWRLMRYYPPLWSSTLCGYHKRQLLVQRLNRRHVRQQQSYLQQSGADQRKIS